MPVTGVYVHFAVNWLTGSCVAVARAHRELGSGVNGVQVPGCATAEVWVDGTVAGDEGAGFVGETVFGHRL